jgi:exosome complex RNA-binding protein Rrp42 (RNase PH superfamily)
MKQEISSSEQTFIRNGFRANLRSDGRQNTDPQPFTVNLGTVEEAFGSSTVTFGEQDT